MVEPARKPGKFPGSFEESVWVRVAAGFSLRAPHEMTKRATHLFPLLSRRWPSAFLELLPPWVVWATHASWAEVFLSSSLVSLISQHSGNSNERPHLLWESSLGGENKGAGQYGEGNKVTQKAKKATANGSLRPSLLTILAWAHPSAHTSGHTLMPPMKTGARMDRLQSDS